MGEATGQAFDTEGEPLFHSDGRPVLDTEIAQWVEEAQRGHDLIQTEHGVVIAPLGEDEDWGRQATIQGSYAQPTILKESARDRETSQWTHHCGTVLKSAKVYHAIHDDPARIYVEWVPYCPTCQDKPAEQGVPITFGED